MLHYLKLNENVSKSEYFFMSYGYELYLCGDFSVVWRTLQCLNVLATSVVMILIEESCK